MTTGIDAALFLILGTISGAALVLLGIDKKLYALMREAKRYIFDIWR